MSSESYIIFNYLRISFSAASRIGPSNVAISSGMTSTYTAQSPVFSSALISRYSWGASSADLPTTTSTPIYAFSLAQNLHVLYGTPASAKASIKLGFYWHKWRHHQSPSQKTLTSGKNRIVINYKVSLFLRFYNLKSIKPKEASRL